MQTLLSFMSWTILHYFLSVSLVRITLTGPGACCIKSGKGNHCACKQKIVESVRGLIDLCYAVVISMWGFYLLLCGRNDIESHAFLYITALGYSLYSTYWALQDFGLHGTRVFPFFNHRFVPTYLGKNKLLNLIQHFLTDFLIAAGIEALENEMSLWKHSAIPLMMDITAGVKKKALSHHLLSKPSNIAWLLTINMVIHEFPNIFFNTIKLMRITSYKPPHQPNLCQMARNPYQSGSESAASIGAAAWKRERGMVKPPAPQSYFVEEIMSKVHRLAFVFVRVLGGFVTLSLILQTEILVRDTIYIAMALLYHGMAIYLFGGIVAYTAKRKMGRKLGLKKSFSWQLATAVSDDWLVYN